MTFSTSERLKRIPVVILTTSNFQCDIDEIYALGASGYFTKPAGLDGYRSTFEAICRYWADRAFIPSKAVR